MFFSVSVEIIIYFLFFLLMCCFMIDVFEKNSLLNLQQKN